MQVLASIRLNESALSVWVYNFLVEWEEQWVDLLVLHPVVQEDLETLVLTLRPEIIKRLSTDYKPKGRFKQQWQTSCVCKWPVIEILMLYRIMQH